MGTGNVTVTDYFKPAVKYKRGCKWFNKIYISCSDSAMNTSLSYHLYETSGWRICMRLVMTSKINPAPSISIVFRHQAHQWRTHPNVDVHAPESPTNMHLSKDYCQEYHSVVTVLVLGGVKLRIVTKLQSWIIGVVILRAHHLIHWLREPSLHL